MGLCSRYQLVNPGRVVFVLLTAAASLACVGPPECDARLELPCPLYFDVCDWCRRTGGCEIDGGELFRGELSQGQVAQIPIGEFASELGGTHDLFFGYLNRPPPDPANALVEIDGVPGAHADPGPLFWPVLIQWEPFPPSPQLLEVWFTDGPSNVDIGVRLEFVDYSCELLQAQIDANRCK